MLGQPIAQYLRARDAARRLRAGPDGAFLGFVNQDALGITRRDNEGAREGVERAMREALPVALREAAAPPPVPQHPLYGADMSDELPDGWR